MKCNIEFHYVMLQKAPNNEICGIKQIQVRNRSPGFQYSASGSSIASWITPCITTPPGGEPSSARPSGRSWRGAPSSSESTPTESDAPLFATVGRTTACSVVIMTVNHALLTTSPVVGRAHVPGVIVSVTLWACYTAIYYLPNTIGLLTYIHTCFRSKHFQNKKSLYLHVRICYGTPLLSYNAVNALYGVVISIYLVVAKSISMVWLFQYMIWLLQYMM